MTVAITNKGRILILKRNPLLLPARNRGIWTFVSGGMEAGEKPVDAAYREVLEETGIERRQLTLLRHIPRIKIYDAVKRNSWWWNDFFVLGSKTAEVRINWEHTAYRWGPISDIEEGRRYTNVFLDEGRILKVLRAWLRDS